RPTDRLSLHAGGASPHWSRSEGPKSPLDGTASSRRLTDFGGTLNLRVRAAPSPWNKCSNVLRRFHSSPNSRGIRGSRLRVCGSACFASRQRTYRACCCLRMSFAVRCPQGCFHATNSSPPDRPCSLKTFY